MNYTQDIYPISEMKIDKDDTKVVINKLYPYIENILNSSKGKLGYKKAITNFINKRETDLYDTVPCSRLFFGKNDEDELFNSMGIDMGFVQECIQETYFVDVDTFSYVPTKDPCTLVLICILRYFIEKNDKKDIELSSIYISFSGKFYPSIHYKSYPTVTPVRFIMEYVCNNRLSAKYDIISEGSVLGAIKSICNTWIVSYKSKFKTFYDADVAYLLLQLHSRIGSFMKNIAEEYYKAYNEKDVYMTYDSDSYDADDYHIADSNSLRVQKISEKTVNKINSTTVNYTLCNASSDVNVKPLEVKSIIESILNEKKNNAIIKELINLLVSTYFNYSGYKDPDVKDISFLTYSITPKPNTKNKDVLRIKEIVELLLEENSTAFLRRRSRIATVNSYNKAILTYFALLIHNSNR